MTTAARAVIFGCAGLRLTAPERAFFASAQPWGAILFGRNLDSPEQITALTADLRDAVGRDLPILIDQEGGRVQRLTPPRWRGFAPALDDADRLSDATRAFWLRGRLIAAQLRVLGIDVNCAPLADIARPDTHAVLRNRCYGTDAAQVARHARAMADGLMAGGVLPVLKHIPGHGRGTLDSHLALPVVTAPRAELDASDFAAFRALADLPLGMTAHLVFTDIDPSSPATTSARMMQVIRDDIGFQGGLISDDISMQALSGSVTARAQAALAAGCDLVLHCNGDLDEMRALADTCPPLSGAALARTDAALAQRTAPAPADLAALDAEYAALIPVS
jgi:beta-N-acetylhexosaminidase